MIRFRPLSGACVENLFSAGYAAFLFAGRPTCRAAVPTRNRVRLPRPINDRMASRGSQRNQLVVPSNHPRMVRTRSLRTQSARRRVDHGTICGRSCANSGHYKALSACVNRIFVDPNSAGRRVGNFFWGLEMPASFALTDGATTEAP